MGRMCMRVCVSGCDNSTKRGEKSALKGGSDSDRYVAKTQTTNDCTEQQNKRITIFKHCKIENLTKKKQQQLILQHFETAKYYSCCNRCNKNGGHAFFNTHLQ